MGRLGEIGWSAEAREGHIMPVDSLVLDNGKLVIERWVGEISHAQLLQHEKQQLDDATIAKGAVVLVDAEQARFSETALDMVHELSDLYADTGNRTGLSKIALLVNPDDWLKAKVFQAQAKTHGVVIITFISLHVACLWLRIDEQRAAHYLKQLLPARGRAPVWNNRQFSATG